MARLRINFFSRNAKKVARDLLGKILCRKHRNQILKARIIETEAYFDKSDPASRACKNGDLKETMEMPAGTILVYGVHNNWLINLVTGKEKEAEAVLLRALEPLNFNKNCSGPGLLTRAISIDKGFHKKDINNCKELWLEENNEKFKIMKSKRVGVKRDLKELLRFYIKDNKFISRK